MNQWRIVDDSPATSAFTLERLTDKGEFAAFDRKSLPENARRLVIHFILSRQAWIDRREGAHFFYRVLG